MAYEAERFWLELDSRTHSNLPSLSYANSGYAASILATNSSSLKCFSSMAKVGHLTQQRPSPLQRIGLMTAFLPCFVSRNSIAPYVHAEIHAPQPKHFFSTTSHTEPDATTGSCERSVKTRPAAP